MMIAQNKINRFGRIVLIFALFTAVVACGDDFYDAKIGDKIYPDQHYKDASDVWSSFNGIVLLLQEIMPNHIILDGLLSDQMETTAAAGAELVTLYNHAVSAGNSYIDGSPYYKVIVSANDVLSNIDAVVEKDKLNYDSLTNVSVKRALIAYRSWAYLNYVRLYGRATIIPEKLLSVEDAENMEIVDKETMLNRLIEDLIPVLHDDESNQAELFITNAVNSKALLGEIYLELNNFDLAAKYLREACESFGRSMYKVDGGFSRENFANIFINPSGAEREVMVYIPFSFEDGQQNPLEIYFKPDYEYTIRPSNVLVHSFSTQKQVGDTIFGDVFRGPGVCYDSIDGSDNEFYISKYSLDPGAVAYSADIVMYRASDIHLMLAEALNRLGQTDIALTLMNDGIKQLSSRPTDFRSWSSNEGVRGRVFLKSLTIPEGTPDVVNYLEDLILEERALELAFEGKRWFDLMRVASRRNDPSYLADKVAAKYSDPAVADRVRQELRIEDNWYLPSVK